MNPGLASPRLLMAQKYLRGHAASSLKPVSVSWCVPALALFLLVGEVLAQTLLPCAREDEVCAFEGVREVWFGAGQSWSNGVYENGVACTAETLGDPAASALRSCLVGSLPLVRLEILNRGPVDMEVSMAWLDEEPMPLQPVSADRVGAYLVYPGDGLLLRAPSLAYEFAYQATGDPLQTVDAIPIAEAGPQPPSAGAAGLPVVSVEIANGEGTAMGVVHLPADGARSILWAVASGDSYVQPLHPGQRIGFYDPQRGGLTGDEFVAGTGDTRIALPYQAPPRPVIPLKERADAILRAVGIENPTSESVIVGLLPEDGSDAAFLFELESGAARHGERSEGA